MSFRTTFAQRAGTLLLAATSILACTQKSDLARPVADVAVWQDSLAKWKAKRLASITAPFGWASLVGLHDLPNGQRTIGRASDNDIVLETEHAPARLGSLDADSTVVRFTADPSVTVTADSQPVTTIALRSDRDSSATVLRSGSLTLGVINRAERRLLRVRDSLAVTRVNFAGLQYFEPDTAWRVAGRWIAYEPARKLPIVNIIGTLEEATSPGAIEFVVGGESYRLDAVAEPGSRELFINFRDQTSDSSSYPSGRFLYAARPDSAGVVLLDFNRAYNPPCAFSAYATCPLSPKQNRLALAIPAGERRYRGGHSSVASAAGRAGQ